MTEQLHRAVHAAEHDPQNGRLHGYCLLCGVQYPCEYIGTPKQAETIDRLRAENEALRAVAKAARKVANRNVMGFEWQRRTLFEALAALNSTSDEQTEDS